MSKNIYDVKETTYLDSETGELVTVESVKRQKISIKSDSFYMTFIDYVAPFFQLKNGTSKSILSWLCGKAIFNTGQVSLGAADRKKLCEELNIRNNVLSNSLRELVNKALIMGSKGSYIINPQVFWKGDLKTREDILNNSEIQVLFKLVPSKEMEPKSCSDFKSDPAVDEFKVKES